MIPEFSKENADKKEFITSLKLKSKQIECGFPIKLAVKSNQL